jgi:hypothetical protein
MGMVKYGSQLSQGCGVTVLPKKKIICYNHLWLDRSLLPTLANPDGTIFYLFFLPAS